MRSTTNGFASPRIVEVTAIGLAVTLTLTSPLETRAANKAPLAQYGDWSLRCLELENALPCDIVESLLQKDSNAQVLAISIAFSPDQEKHAIQIALPLGIDLRRGADIHVGNVQAKGVRITRCELSGCIIEAILAPDMLEAMRSTEKGTITVSANGKTDTNIEFSLKGFLEADEALKSETIARKR